MREYATGLGWKVRNMRIDTRADRVISWLERMKKSYHSGHVESAYFDAECARADLDDLRSAVFSSISPRRINPVPFMRIAVLALSAVLAYAEPLSRPVNVLPVIEARETHADTPRETHADVPRNIRASAEPSPQTKRPRRPASSRKAPKPSSEAKTPPVKKAAYDKVPYLLQTGQQAMKSSIHINQGRNNP